MPDTTTTCTRCRFVAHPGLPRADRRVLVPVVDSTGCSAVCTSCLVQIFAAVQTAAEVTVFMAGPMVVTR